MKWEHGNNEHAFEYAQRAMKSNVVVLFNEIFYLSNSINNPVILTTPKPGARIISLQLPRTPQIPNN